MPGNESNHFVRQIAVFQQVSWQVDCDFHTSPLLCPLTLRLYGLTENLPEQCFVHVGCAYRVHEAGRTQDPVLRVEPANQSFGRMVAFHGQMGMFTRALTYMLSHGADGLKQVAEDAVLNANYIRESLKDVMTPSFDGPCMHEALFDDRFLKDTGVSTLDFAKALIDEGFHPMTMYFPLVVHGAMLVEPTETESKAAIDQFITAFRAVVERALAGDKALKQAPYYAPRRRLDETAAARKPKLAFEG